MLHINIIYNARYWYNTCPIKPVFLELFTVVAVEYFIHGYDVSGVRASRPLRLAHRRTHDVGHFGEQVERMISGVLDDTWVEFFESRVPNVHSHFTRIGHRRFIQHVICNEREHGCVENKQRSISIMLSLFI